MGIRAESWNCSTQKRLRERLTKVYEYPMETTKKVELHSSQQCPIKVQQAQTGIQNFFCQPKITFFQHPNSSQTLEQVVYQEMLEFPSWEVTENSLAMVLSNLLQLTLPGGQDCTGLSAELLPNLSYSVDSGQKQYALHTSQSPTCFPVTIQQLHFHEKLVSY